jgi:hypothetical protein
MLRRYEKAWKDRLEGALARWMLDIDDPIEDSINMHFVERYQEATECRYFQKHHRLKFLPVSLPIARSHLPRR